MASDSADWPGWAQVVLGAVMGTFAAAGVLIRLVFTMNSRLQKLEDKDVTASIRDELARERHDVLYPVLQTRVYAALDKIEEETKIQGQNIAVLLERDRTASAIKELAEAIRHISQDKTEK